MSRTVKSHLHACSSSSILKSHACSMQWVFTGRPCVHTNHHTVSIIPAGCSVFIWPLYSQRADLCLDWGSNAATLCSLHMFAYASLSTVHFCGPACPWHAAFTSCIQWHPDQCWWIFFHETAAIWKVFFFLTSDECSYKCSYLQTYSNDFLSSLFMFILQ